MTTKPYASSRLATYLRKRILELRPAKSQGQIATEAGFTNVNMLAMIKSGATKLPLDRVPALATALDADPARLFLLALEQSEGWTLGTAIEEVFGTVVTRNEVAWLKELRSASDGADPSLTTRSRVAFRAIFGK
jgi:hypothetical protein